MIKIHDEDISTSCQLCGRHYKHSVRYYKTDESGIKEADLITHCASCRNLLHRIKETKRKLQDLESEAEYYMFIKDK